MISNSFKRRREDSGLRGALHETSPSFQGSLAAAEVLDESAQRLLKAALFLSLSLRRDPGLRRRRAAAQLLDLGIDSFNGFFGKRHSTALFGGLFGGFCFRRPLGETRARAVGRGGRWQGVFRFCLDTGLPKDLALRTLTAQLLTFFCWTVICLITPSRECKSKGQRTGAALPFLLVGRRLQNAFEWQGRLRRAFLGR